jgi:signal peptidase I
MIFLGGILWNYFPTWLDKRIERFEIPSESMLPTLQVGDRVFVKKSGNYRPKRGDIVIFQTPEKVKELDPASGDFFIKRVIGVAGDKIQVHQGQVYLDEQRLEEPYTPELADYELPSLIVPPKMLFVLGDNRTHSFDSHAWGFLPEDHLVGPAYKIYWPLHHVRSLDLSR